MIPVFVLDETLLASSRVSGPRIAWMLEGLQVLDADLRVFGSSLVIRRGDPVSELLALCQEIQADGVYFNRDYGPYAVRRDREVMQSLAAAGFEVRTFKDGVMHEADEFARAYEVYTPFRKAWSALPKPEVIDIDHHRERLRLSSPVASLPLPVAAELLSRPAASPIVPVGESNASVRLAAFCAGPIYAYGTQRNRPDIDSTAIMSPYLRWGMVSPRQCYWAAMQAAAIAPTETERHGVETWIAELVWREFFSQLLAHNPTSVTFNLHRSFDKVDWQNRQDWLDAWVDGRTGYPIVDAAMRQLHATGWLHNRARLIVASFLCKDLLIDWRKGEAVFMRCLLDADVASNVGNWQWSAGTGADAAPYFRIFNPTTQGEKFDPEGDYIRRWVSELAQVPKPFIHRPEMMTVAQQHAAKCVLGSDYPLPIVDHAEQRNRALSMYAAARSQNPS